MPLGEIDPPAVPRPVGHAEAVSWREVCRAEFYSPRFACVHTIIGPSSQQGTCSLCQRVFDTEAGTEQDYRLLKFILTGSATVGKTSFMRQFIDGVYANTDTRSTIGIDFDVKRCRTMDDVEVKLQIWDTAGQARFRSITKAYYRGTAGCAVLFDVSRRETFKDIEQSWWPEFVDSQHAKRTAPRTVEECACAVVLVGIRQDLTTGRARAVTKLEAYRLAEHMEKTLALDTNHQRVHYVEANPATGDGVARVFATLVKTRLRSEARVPDTPLLDELHDDPYATEHVAKNHCVVM
eukprot:COSAG02_NODE_541_length_20598_cov_278.953754_14_plen_294_part_00